MRKTFWATFGGQLLAQLVPVALIGVGVWLAWRKVFGPSKTVADVVEGTLDAAATIPSGVVSVLGSAFRGESEDGYKTDAQMRQEAAAALAARRGQ